MVGHYHPCDDLRRAALRYAERGWPVFPIRPGTKKPAVPTHPADACDGTDPRCAIAHAGWEQRATTDPDRIERAWRARPWGIGIATGPAGLLVVDLDLATTGGPCGIESLEQLQAERDRRLPSTFTVATPSGGRHLYFARGELELGNTAGRLAPRIDSRAMGGYVVAPPTPLAGGRYLVLEDCPAAELPEWFSQLLAPPMRPSQRPRPTLVDVAGDERIRRYVAAAVDGELDRIASAPDGRRNHTLFTSSVAIGQLVGAELLAVSEAEQLLEQAAGRHLAAGAYSPAQARKTIASGLRRGANEPRHLPTELISRSTR